ncbi:MAG TPA: hypothetical protein VKK31_13205 [Thermoanaerobaculia bacterium]|nr:hypothetical protein [Thermoanaerobaculia bacterium]
MRRNPAAFAILVGGAIAGAIDITYAIVFAGFRGAPASRILQSVASGLLGEAAFEGGTATAALGLFLHFFIACLWAAIFYVASRRFPLLIQRAILCGALYGVVVYAVMNLVVLPLSAFPRQVRFPPLALITGLIVHMFGVGLPIALAARKASRQAVS